MSLSNSSIKILPEHLIDQIKAGEVIERPANVFKELIENAIDAGSSKIDIHILSNGLDLISIKDNGKGISAEDLPYAFLRHATSKLNRFEDLYNLYTYGFRGEALASISAVSKLQCVSSTGKEASKITIHGGEITSSDHYHKDETGTEIYIKDLFYNTPARLKFIKSERVEKNNIQKILTSFLLSNPAVDFSIRWDDRDREAFQSSDLRSRVARVFSRTKSGSEVQFISKEYDGIYCDLYFSQESSRGNQNKQHYLFVNSRMIHDRQLHNIIINQLKNYWHEGETGHYCLFLKMPPAQVDVNVHPNKIQVKFENASPVHTLVASSLKDFLAKSIDIPRSTQNFDSALSMDIQAYDLKERDFSAPMHDSYSTSLSRNSDDQFNMLDEEESCSILFRFESGNSLAVINGVIYFLSLKILIIEYLIQQYQAVSCLDEENCPPLLISKPFNGGSTTDEYFSFLLTLGLEFDRLDQTTIALRSMPLFYNDLPADDIIQQIIETLPSTGAIANRDLFERLNILTPISTISMLSLLKSFTISEALNFKILKQVNEKALSK